eukprot:c4747_g1_i1.p1 GENE.c4747_g1_i1~~c4747_g1_i1.p1  ORF type:complete len:288 (+),score=78.29 c4747_g1_i1:22-885(+)
MEGSNAKFEGKFGLVLPQPKKEKKRELIANNFNIEADEETFAHSLFGHSGAFKRTKQKIEKEQAEILETDPTAFAYDEVYDEIQHDRLEQAQEKLLPAHVRRESKYIDKLKQKAVVRNIDLQRAQDRKFQREAEVDKELFVDKPKFITSKYKEQVSEMQKWNKITAARDAEDAANSAEKRKDMAGFLVNLTGIVSGTTVRPLGPEQPTKTTKSDPVPVTPSPTDKQPTPEADKQEQQDEQAVQDTAKAPSETQPSAEEKLKAERAAREAEKEAARQRYLERKKQGIK